MKEGSQAGKAVGHLIPAQFWKYINSADIAPDGWKTDFGPPLTEALAFNSREPDGSHHLRSGVSARLEHGRIARRQTQ